MADTTLRPRTATALQLQIYSGSLLIATVRCSILHPARRSVHLYCVALGATTISFILSHRMIIDSYPTYYHQLHFTQFQVQNLCRMRYDLENLVSKHALVFNPKPTIEIQNTKSQNQSKIWPLFWKMT